MRRHRSCAAIAAALVVVVTMLVGLAIAGSTVLPDSNPVPTAAEGSPSTADHAVPGANGDGPAGTTVGVSNDSSSTRTGSTGDERATPADGTGSTDGARGVSTPAGSTKRSADLRNGTEGRILAVYPNPVPRGDSGEYVVVRTGHGNWTLSDGEARVSIPARSTPIALSPDPERARSLVDAPVDRIPDDLSLANAGETLRLRRNGTVVDRSSYRSAPEAEQWVRTNGGAPGFSPAGPNGTATWSWQPIGASNHPVATATGSNVTAFVLPDSPRVPLRTGRAAEGRLWVAAYTFESRRIADAMRAAAARGVDVRLLVEGAPVGGITRREATLLDELNGSGVSIRAVDGPYTRYDFHHGKYAVVDDRALVMTENWKPSGTGGRSNRGWGAVVHDASTADALAAVFREDYRWRAATPWTEFRRTRRFEAAEPSPGGSYPSRIAPERIPARSVSLAVAPDNAGRATIDAVRSANRSIDVIQASIDDGPLLRETVRAAERNVRVRILLSGAWYTADDNRALADRLNRRADREELPLTAKVATGGDRFERIHAKGVVIDGRTAIVGSLNWNPHARTENREVVLLLRGDEVGHYFAAAFRADWSGGGGSLPIGLPAVALVLIAAVAWLLRRLVTVDARDGIGP